MKPGIYELSKNFFRFTDSSGASLFFSYGVCVGFDIEDRAGVLETKSRRGTISHTKELLPDAPRFQSEADFLRHIQVALVDAGADIKKLTDELPSLYIDKDYKCITTSLGTRIGVSYSTIIGFQQQDQDIVVRINGWGPTTGRHISAFKRDAVEGGNVTILPSDEFERILDIELSMTLPSRAVASPRPR